MLFHSLGSTARPTGADGAGANAETKPGLLARLHNQLVSFIDWIEFHDVPTGYTGTVVSIRLEVVTEGMSSPMLTSGFGLPLSVTLVQVQLDAYDQIVSVYAPDDFDAPAGTKVHLTATPIRYFGGRWWWLCTKHWRFCGVEPAAA